MQPLAPPPEQTRQTHNVRIGAPPSLYVKFVGDGDLLLFLHGLGGHHSDWDLQLPFFGDRYRAAAWDARSYGGSDDYEGTITIEMLAQDLRRVIDHFGVDSAHIVGLSMGGIIAQEFARQSPERIKSLVLADTFIGMHEALGEEAVQAFVTTRRDALLSGVTPAALGERVAPRIVGTNAPASARAKVLRSFALLRPEAYLRHLEAVSTYRNRLDHASLDIPTLVIVGAQDLLCPPSSAREIATRIPRSELVVIDDAGHVPNVEKPREFNAALARFLSQVSTKRN